MNKILVITVLVTLLALNVESFRVPRQAEAEPEEEEAGTFTKISNTVKSYYDSLVNTASGYMDSIRGLKLEEKAGNLYADTTSIVGTYAGIAQDQIYYFFSS